MMMTAWALPLVTAAALLLPLAAAAAGDGGGGGGGGGGRTGSSTSSPTPDKDGKFWIHGDGVSAAFVPYGASIANLIFRDQYGVARDLVGGFDNASYYTADKQHPHFGGVPGRYANRIKNSSFEIDGRRYKVEANENRTPAAPDGVNTLHGGPDGWDWRNFSVVSHSRSSITFSLVDPDGKEGFPGEVASVITYALAGRDWDITMVATAMTAKTPIMLSSHTYWNLDGFANNETNTALNHTVYLPYSGQRVGVDSILIPTGDILPNARGSVNDFWSRPRQLGAAFGDAQLDGNCGFNCTGYDNCFTINRGSLGNFDWRTEGPVATLSSAWSGIRLDVFTDQHAFQLYSCNGQNGTMALKKTQGVGSGGGGEKRDAKAKGGAAGFPRTIAKYGCVVLEVQDYIDGINHPEWMRKQVYGPSDDPYVLRAKYRFSLTSEHEREREAKEL